MIGTLQKKFVITAMIAITVLILFLLGAINIANIIIVGNQVERTLQIISKTESGAGLQFPKPNNVFPEPHMGMPKNDYDIFMSSNFFVVGFDESGNIVYKDISRTSSVSEEEAEQLAMQIYNMGEKSGKIQKFRFIMNDNYIREGKNIVFLDISEEIFSYIRVLLLSGAAGLLCWGLMLIFVILLSRKAIKPIAENIEKQKQFVTNAGHEIKTPIAIIQSNTEAMELYNGENKWSRNIKEQTARLSGLMKNLLTLARMDESGVQVNLNDFCLSELCEKTIQSFMQSIEEKNIFLYKEIQADIYFHADKMQIEEMIFILLDNAVKYTNDSGKIMIYLKKNDKHINFKVQNTCENIPEVSSDKLFDRFYRADTSRTQKNGGYGLGLSIASSFVSANKGHIYAEYIKPNIVCFTVNF